VFFIATALSLYCRGPYPHGFDLLPRVCACGADLVVSSIFLAEAYQSILGFVRGVTIGRRVLVRVRLLIVFTEILSGP
jgi:hypothetical protein